MKLIIITGTNHSGTSALAKLLIDNGFETGIVNEEHSMQYPTHENNNLHGFVRNLLGISSEGINYGVKLFDELVELADNKKNVVLKYPRAIHAMDSIIPLIEEAGYDDIRIIHMVRDYNDFVASNYKKTDGRVETMSLALEFINALSIADSITDHPVRIQLFNRLINLKDVSEIEHFIDNKITVTTGVSYDKVSQDK